MSDIEGLSESEDKKKYFDKDYMLKRGKKKSRSSELESGIIKWVKLQGGAARRVNTQGQYDEKRQMWRPSGMKRGFEDVDATMKIPVIGKGYIGIKIAIEVKIGRDKMSEYQVARQKEVADAGGYYIVAKDMDQFMYDWNSIKIICYDKINTK